MECFPKSDRRRHAKGIGPARSLSQNRESDAEVQAAGANPRYTQRTAAADEVCGLARRVLNHLATIAHPDTIRRWIREARKSGTKRPHRGRRLTQEEIRTLILKLARENDGWGYTGANHAALKAVQVTDRWHLLHNVHEVLTRIMELFPAEISRAASVAF